MKFDQVYIADEIVLEEYSQEDVVYHMERVIEADLIDDIDVHTFSKNYMIKSLTYSGHCFLDNVQDESL